MVRLKPRHYVVTAHYYVPYVVSGFSGTRPRFVLFGYAGGGRHGGTAGSDASGHTSTSML
jgi:hypothetical protein